MKFYQQLIVLSLLALLPKSGNAQQILANYSFDNCDFIDETGQFDPASTIFPPSCDCGLNENGLYFDGSNDHLNFPDTLVNNLEEDFTISFYARFDNLTNRTDILSVRSECTLDSFISLTFNPFDQSIVFDIAQNISSFESYSAPINQARCWHRIVLTKSDLFYNLYVDGKLGASVLSDGIITFSKSAKLSLANSPCLAINEDRFRGWIDEFIIYGRALSSVELFNNSLNPDQITSNDTTVVANSEVPITVGATCAINFSWSPSVFLDDPALLDPIASPEQTITYILTIENQGNCTSRDSMTINVIDPNEIDCAEILLPNAFTPNNDLLNDQYGISNLFLVDEIEYFEIYDRWGAKMWNGINKNDKWDGSYKGNPVNPGMYMYKIKYSCNGEEFVKVDNFSVLR